MVGLKGLLGHTRMQVISGLINGPKKKYILLSIIDIIERDFKLNSRLDFAKLIEILTLTMNRSRRSA